MDGGGAGFRNLCEDIESAEFRGLCVDVEVG